MASIEYRKKTTKVIAYINKRKLTFSLGRVPKKTAVRFTNKVDDLIYADRCNFTPSRETSWWMKGLDDSLCERPVDAGSSPKQNRAAGTVTALCRFAGLRGSSEVALPTWEDVLLVRGHGRNDPKNRTLWQSEWNRSVVPLTTAVPTGSL